MTTQPIRIDLETTTNRCTLHATSEQDAIRRVFAHTMPLVRARIYTHTNTLLGTIKTRQDSACRRWIGYYRANGAPTWERRL